MINFMLDGKEIILQRLRGKTPKLSKYRKLDHETTDVFDFCSKKYDAYRKNFDDNKLTFHIIKKSGVSKYLMRNEDKEKYENLLKIPKDLKIRGKLSKDAIDEYVNKYDEKTNRFYDKLCYFKELQNDSLKDKNINPLFMVNYIIGGKLSNGEIFYAPFAFQEVKIDINHRNREVKFDQKNGQIFANIPFITYLGNDLNIAVENELENIDNSGDEQDTYAKILAIYKKLGIKLDLSDLFSHRKCKELKISYENKSSKIDENTAIHEARHLVCALHYEYFVDSVDINNDNIKLGEMSCYNDENDNYEKELVITIAPHLQEINSWQEVIAKQNLPIDDDFAKIIDCVENLAEENNTKKDEIFQKYYCEAQNLLEKYQWKIEQFKYLLMKFKTLDHEEIMQQWEKNELIEINREQNEVKFTKNNFFVEHVKLIMHCPELTEHGIYKDVKHIFQTDFIENFLSQSKPINHQSIDQLAWGFAADFKQQQAVIKAKLNDNIIIQGPPGTGKTQTILNIIIDALFNNKKILICAEKTTALNVIEDRIKINAPILNNFIFKLYDNSGDICFFQELAKKMVNIAEKTKTVSNTSSFLFDYKSEEKKIQQIKRLGNKLLELNLSNLCCDYKKMNDEFTKMGITKQNIIDLLNSIETSDLNELLEKEGEIETIENWKKQYDSCNIFRNKYFASNLSSDKIKKIYELNNSLTYNEESRWQYGLYYYKNKTNTNIFLRFFSKRKYDKMAKKLNFDTLFSNPAYQEFTNYYKFDDKKYSDKDLAIFQDIKKFITKI